MKARLSRVFCSCLLLLGLLIPTIRGFAAEKTVQSPELRAAIRSATEGNYAGALKQFEPLLAADSKNALLLYYVGLCHYFQGDPHRAVTFLEESIARKAEFPEAYYWAARAHRSIDEKERAKECLRMGLERFPGNKKLRALE